jgi:hypothetical protein
METEFLLVKDHVVEDDLLTSERHEPYGLRTWQLPIGEQIQMKFDTIRINAAVGGMIGDFKKVLAKLRDRKPN